MELFRKAKTVRLLSYLDKYLVAEADQETVSQDRDGSSENAKWTVEILEGENYLRLKSCHGKYLTASNLPFLPGVSGRQVLQTHPKKKSDSSIDWEPERDGFQVRLKTRYGYFLRPYGGLPPWRNSVTHDLPHRSGTKDKILWDVDVVDAFEKTTSHRRMRSAFL